MMMLCSLHHHLKGQIRGLHAGAIGTDEALASASKAIHLFSQMSTLSGDIKGFITVLGTNLLAINDTKIENLDACLVKLIKLHFETIIWRNFDLLI